MTKQAQEDYKGTDFVLVSAATYNIQFLRTHKQTTIAAEKGEKAGTSYR